MSVQTEIARIAQAKTDIKNVVNSKVANTITNQTIDAFPPLIDSSIAAYKNLIPWIEGGGSSFTIDNAEAGKLDKFEIYGNTHQDSYTGNQLIDFNNMQLSEDTTFSFTNNIFTVSSTAGTYRSAYQFITDIFKNNPGKTLTFKEESYYVQTTAGNPAIQLRITYSDETPTRYTVIRNYQNNTTTPYTIPNDTSNIATVRVHAYTNNTNVERANILTITKPLLYFDNNDTYEPFVGGSPSPSPDYPQDIEVVTGDNTINVHGKNLFDKNNANNLLNNVSINYSNGVISNTNGFYTLRIDCKPNTTYTISKVVSSRFVVAYSNNLTYTSGETLLGKVSNYSATNLTITTGQNAKSLYVFYSKLSDETTYTLQEILDSIQIEEGSTASDYEEYQSQTYPLNLGSIELCKIGDYQDYIYKENNKWYKYNEIGKVVLDGSENYYFYSIDDKIMRFQPIDMNGIAIPQTPYYSDKFIYMGKVAEIHEVGITSGASTTRSSCFIFINKTIANTVEEFKTWLSTHNTIVYYVLATPTNTEITDTDLINQLNAIETYTGTNIFSVSNSNGVLPDLYVLTEKQNSYKN